MVEIKRAKLLGVYNLDGSIKEQGQEMKRSYTEMVGKEGDFLITPMFHLCDFKIMSVKSKNPDISPEEAKPIIKDWFEEHLSKRFTIQWVSEEKKGFHTSQIINEKVEGNIHIFKRKTIFLNLKYWEVM